MRTCCVILITIVGLSTAISQTDTELDSLKKQRTRAIAEAIRPIDAKYHAALEALLADATKRKDYETAKKILAEIGAKQPLGDQPLSRRLIDSRWSWPSPEFEPEKAWFQLHADGSTTSGWHKNRGTWKALDGSTIRIKVLSTSSHTYTLEFDRALKWAWDTDRPHVVFRLLPPE